DEDKEGVCEGVERARRGDARSEAGSRQQHEHEGSEDHGATLIAGRPAPSRRPDRRLVFAPVRVAALGGGVSGMSAAHELIERGFEVAVYEKGTLPGGKARSIPVPGSGQPPRLD